MQRRNSGFTLIELLVVVAIITILAILAVTTYRRFMARARNTEVSAMFAEIRAKEEAYRAEFAAYASTTVVGEGDFYPQIIGQLGEPKVQQWAPPTSAVVGQGAWTALGVRPPRTQLYCGYVVIAGTPGVWSPLTTSYTQSFLKNFSNNGGGAPGVAYWVALAMCDNDGVPCNSWNPNGYPANCNNAVFTTSSQTSTVRTENPVE